MIHIPGMNFPTDVLVTPYTHLHKPFLDLFMSAKEKAVSQNLGLEMI